MTKTPSNKEREFIIWLLIIWEICGNYQAIDMPSEYTTTDEHLVVFHGPCSLRQYIPQNLQYMK